MTTASLPNPRAAEWRIWQPEYLYKYTREQRALRNTKVRVSEWYPTWIRAGLDEKREPLYSVRWEGWVMELGRLVPEGELAAIPKPKKACDEC